MLSPALAVLVKYAASGIGSVAGSMLAPWSARKRGAAKRIDALADADVQRIGAEGEADALNTRAVGQSGSLPLIAAAQEEAQRQMEGADSTFTSEVSISRAEIDQRILFQEEKRQRNIGAVLAGAAEQLGDSEVRDHEPNPDWTARFFEEVQDVSSEEMQGLWSKILAGEVERPGSTSTRTLAILRNMDRSTAGLFSHLCSICVYFSLDDRLEDARAVYLSKGYAEGNGLKDYGLDYRSLNVLNEHGLIVSEYNSWHDYRSSVGMRVDNDTIYIPIQHQSRYWVLIPNARFRSGKEFRVHGVALSASGTELSRVVTIGQVGSYTADLSTFLASKHLQMTEVPSKSPRVVQNQS